MNEQEQVVPDTECRQGINQVLEIMRRLRAPNGCPWDRKQTHESLRPYLIEETYEFFEAIEHNDDMAMAEELGDVLLQVVFHAQIAAEEGRFDFQTVCRLLSEKLIRRHPHVFAEAEAETADDVIQRWQAIKAQEKKAASDGKASASSPSVLDGVPRHLPALVRAQKLQARAADVGFDWEKAADVIPKLHEEIDELAEAVEKSDRDAMEDELGDLLFAVVNLSRKLGIDAELALQRASGKFAARFRKVEQIFAGEQREMSDVGLAELDAVWDRVKQEDGNTP